MSARFVLLIISAMLIACSAEKKAHKSFRLGKYQNSIDQYKKIAGNSNNGRANYFIAESYRVSNRIKEAEPYYAKAGGVSVTGSEGLRPNISFTSLVTTGMFFSGPFGSRLAKYVLGNAMKMCKCLE